MSTPPSDPYGVVPPRLLYPYGPKRPQSTFARRVGLAIAGLAMLTIVAAVLSWGWDGSQALYGVSTEVEDGIVTIVFAVPCLVLGVLRAFIRRGAGTSLAAVIVALVAGALVALIGIADLMDPSSDAHFTRGPGLWLTAIAGVAMCVVGIVGIVRRR